MKYDGIIYIFISRMTSKASGHNSVRKVYLDVIDDVISNVSEMLVRDY